MSPLALIIAGPNGSGKSTTIDRLRADASWQFPEAYINADDIAREKRDEGFPGSTAELNQFAFNEARRLRAEFREGGVPHAMETVFSHNSTLVDMALLREAGFRVVLIFVSTRDPEINVRRVRARVLRGGHDINEDKIRQRYVRSLAFLPRAAELAGTAYVYDNSGTTSKLLGTVESGIWTRILNTSPSYIERHLIVPLRERREEREELGLFAEDQGLLIPSEETEHRPEGKTMGRIYAGPILHAGRHFVLQEVEEDGEMVRYRHDSIWMRDRLTADHVGERLAIQYWGDSASNEGTVLS